MTELNPHASILTDKLDTYLTKTPLDAENVELELELIESLKNRSVFNYFMILNKIDYPMEKIHLLVEHICRLTQSSSSNLDLEPESDSSSSDGSESESESESEREHERDSELRRRDNQFGLLFDSSTDSKKIDSKTDTDGGDNGE